jgi:hypothetical protein
MGYDTRFKGTFTLSRQLTLDEVNELLDIAHEKSEDFNWTRVNKTPDSHLAWIPTRDGRGIRFDDNSEKFRNYVEWLQWLMDNPLRRMGITVSGEVTFQGESMDDVGMVAIVDGKACKQPLRMTATEKKATAILDMLRRDRRAGFEPDRDDYARLRAGIVKILDAA